MVYTSLVVNLIGQRSRDVISHLSVSRDVIGCIDPCFCHTVVAVFFLSALEEYTSAELIFKIFLNVCDFFFQGSLRPFQNGDSFRYCAYVSNI